MAPSGKRRASYGGALKAAAMAEMEENDDEAEREELRQQKEEEAKLAVMSSPYKEKNKSDKTLKAESNLFAKLSTTIGLCTENKINSGNSFSTELLENLHLMVGMDDSETNFQQASCALDAGVKIYEKRVDNVHQSTLKMLGGINRTQDVADDEGCPDNSDGEDGEEDDDEEVVKKPKRRKVNAQTIETNLANINMRPEDLTKVFDPLFHMMSGKFDEGGARGMLLHNLNVSTSGGIIFDSLPAADTDGASSLGEESMESSLSAALLSKLQGISLPSSKLCPEFEAYSKHVESELEKDPVEAGSSQEEAPDLDSEPEDNFMEDHGDDMELGDDAAGYSGFDESSPMQQAAQEHAGPVARPTWNQMQCALDDGINFSDEYSFFGKKLQSSWAGGAGAWKPVADKANKEEAKKKKAEKVAMVIDFSTVNEMDFGASFDLPARAGADRLSDNAIEKSLEQASSLLLPSDHQYKAEELLSLFLRRKKRVKRFTANVRATSEAGEGEQAYNYSNMADTNYVAPQELDFDDHDQGFDDDFDAGEEVQGGGGFEFVAEPTKVAKIEVHYERTAKKLDVKKLKESMWSRIQVPEEEEETPEEKEAEPVLFTDVLKDIPGIVNPDDKATVSVPFCFICLLHLANEKTLELHDTLDLSQLTISCDA